MSGKDDEPWALASGESTEKMLRALLAAVPTFVTRIDADDVIRYVNVLERGQDGAGILGLSVYELIDPEFHEAARACYTRVRTEGGVHSYTSRAGLPGQMRTYDNYISAIDDPDGRVGCCIVAVDVTDQHSRDAKLEEREVLLRLASEASGIGLWIWDLRSGEMLRDSRTREMFGAQELVFEEFLDERVHPADRERVRASMARSIERGTIDPARFRVVMPDDTLRWYSSVGRVERDADGQPTRLIGATIDDTERELLEQRARQAERAEALSGLTAGIAHNFNNMLMIITPVLDLLEDEVPPSFRQEVQEALTAAQRSADMVRDLMVYSGQGSSTGDRLPGRIDEAIAKLTRQLERVWPSNTLVLVEGLDVPVWVTLTATELEQVLLNLLLNARDALEPEARAPRIAIRLSRSEEDVVLEVEDNGCGMPDDVRRKVFDPFFTTKGVRGNGLGLSSVHAVVTHSGGAIDCFSQPARGTRFVLTLPRAPDMIADAQTATPLDATEVLVVDDEPGVRSITRRGLQARGCAVTTAGSVREAEALLNADPTPAFDVVLLDRTMPDRSGLELVPLLREKVPSAHVMLFTGEPDFDADGVDGVLVKPVRIRELVERIRQACAPR